MFKLIFLQNYRLDLLRACRKRNVFFRVVLGSEVVVSVPALKSCWTRNASIFCTMGSTWLWNSCFAKTTGLISSRSQSEAFYFCWNIPLKVVVQWNPYEPEMPENAVSLDMLKFHQLYLLRFSIRVSIGSFLLEVDCSFLNILKNVLDVGIGVLMERKWQKFCSYWDLAIPTCPSRKLIIWILLSNYLMVRNCWKFRLLFVSRRSSNSYYSRVTGMNSHDKVSVETILSMTGCSWKWFGVCWINITCAALMENIALRLRLLFLFGLFIGSLLARVLRSADSPLCK